MALTTEACYTALLALQTNALENLRQRDHFKQSGLATVKLRLLNPNGSPKMVRKELLLSSLGSDFKELVSRDFDLPPQKYVSNNCCVNYPANGLFQTEDYCWREGNTGRSELGQPGCSERASDHGDCFERLGHRRQGRRGQVQGVGRR